MIVTELWEDDGLDRAPMVYLLRGQYIEALDCLGTVCILMDVPIRSYHGVMGRRRKLQTGTKEGNGAEIAAIEDRGGSRSEPRAPEGIRESPALWVKIAGRLLH